MDKEVTVEDRIEAVYGAILDHRRDMERALDDLRDIEIAIKLDNKDEFMAAKNGEQRELLMAEWTRGDRNYQSIKNRYRSKKLSLRLALLEADGLRLLVAAKAVS